GDDEGGGEGQPQSEIGRKPGKQYEKDEGRKAQQKGHASAQIGFGFEKEKGGTSGTSRPLGLFRRCRRWRRRGGFGGRVFLDVAIVHPQTRDARRCGTAALHLAECGNGFVI